MWLYKPRVTGATSGHFYVHIYCIRTGISYQLFYMHVCDASNNFAYCDIVHNIVNMGNNGDIW